MASEVLNCKVVISDKAVMARILENAQKFSGVRVGIFNGATNDVTGDLIAEYAMKNEFGGDGVPARPFMRSTIAEQAEKWGNIFSYEVKKLDVTKQPFDHALGMLGRKASQDVKDKIGSNMPPPNKPETLLAKAKRGGTPSTLIDTGQMQNAVGFEILGKGGEPISGSGR